MRTNPVLLAAALSLLSCGKKKTEEGAAPGSAAPGSAAPAAVVPSGSPKDCTVMVRAVDRTIPELEKALGEAVPKDKLALIPPKMKEVFLARCNEDKWPTVYLDCVDVAKTVEEIEKCDSMLPAGLKKKADDAMEEALKPLLPEDPAEEPESEGSAVGSGAQGSAAAAGSATGSGSGSSTK